MSKKPKPIPSDDSVEPNASWLEPRKTHCHACPFIDTAPEEAKALRKHLTERSFVETRVCHNTGGPNAFHPEGTGKPPLACRGSRDIQLRMFHAMNFLKEPTDEEWARMVELCKPKNNKPKK